MQKIQLLYIVLFLMPLCVMSQEYPIYITEKGYMIVQVEVADGVTGNFVLDTGAGANVLSAKMFEKISDKAISKGYFTGFRHDGDRLDAEIYEIPYLALGEVKQEKPIVGVYPPLDAMGVDGLLSLKFFEDKPFSIDYANAKIIFLKDAEARELAETHTAIPMQFHLHTNVMLDIFIPIAINDSLEVLAEFDTGSGYDGYLIRQEYITDLNIDQGSIVEKKYTTQLSREERTDMVAQLTSLSVGEGSSKIEKENIDVVFREGMIFNALIGSGLFRESIITIDIPNKVFIVGS